MPSCKKCNTTYVPTDVDDGYCSFECWENDNCSTPAIQEEIMTVNDE